MRKVLCNASGVNHYLTSNQRKNLAQIFRRFLLRFWKFSPKICESCGAIYQRIYEMFSALQSTSGPLTYGENNV